MYSNGKNIIITKEVAKTAAAASHRAMETWQKAAGIIPICVRLAITVCGGDRYQDTGEGARSMVGPLSFTLPHPRPGLATTQSRSQPDPVLTHLVSFRVSPSLHASLTGTEPFKRKEKWRELCLALWVRECVRKCLCVRMALLSYSWSQWPTLTNDQPQAHEVREEVGKPVASEDCMNWSGWRTIIILTV